MSDNSRNKHMFAGHNNQFRARKVMAKVDHNEIWEDNVIEWTTYYRRNIHRFIRHYFGIILHWYQDLWVYFMSICDNFVAIAARSAAKSWLIGILASARATLYPGSEVVIVATTLKQADVIIKKIKMLQNDYCNLAREISDYNATEHSFIFHNGSTIRIAGCRESSRGMRSTFTIGEEFRIMDKERFDKIARPFAYVRQAAYLTNPDYAHLREEPKEILISSAYYKGMWWYQETINVIKMMLRGQSAGFFALDYLIAINHGIKTKKVIERERALTDEITFMMELLLA